MEYVINRLVTNRKNRTSEICIGEYELNRGCG
jgi:hypothetical protein